MSKIKDVKTGKPILDTIERLTEEIEESERKWDQLDSQGNRVEEQIRIAKVISKLESMIKFLKKVNSVRKDI